MGRTPRGCRALRATLVALFLLGSAVTVGLSPPSPASADVGAEQGFIRITENGQFDATHGIRSGSGTAEDPYLITGLHLNQLVIKDTDAFLTITDNTIHSLVLDWAGHGLVVRGNNIGDLRVNQNVRRTGQPTSGVIENNTFGVVGQLRHWDGVFQNNTVGAPPDASQPGSELFSAARAVNFDGFNGAVFANNTIYGYMDARLHGHHHGSGYGTTSHNHGAGAHDMSDHTKRYHEVWITNNKIMASSRYGLAYLDTAHPANDRTAPSERNSALNAPHVHHTKVHITGNELTGSGLAMITFNADDRLHQVKAPGQVEVAGNRIDLTGRGNPALAGAERPAGVNLADFDAAAVNLCDNEVKGAYYGVRAADFTDTVTWTVHGLRAEGAAEAVHWDQSVKNQPDVNDGAGASPCSRL